MDDQKEIYWLWYEYLKRSAPYKSFCEEWGKECYKEGLVSASRGLPMPEKLKNHPMADTFKIFLNPRKTDFETWFKYMQLRVTSITPLWNDLKKPVAEYSQLVEEDIDLCTKIFAEVCDREPSIRELKMIYVDMVMKERKDMKLVFYVDCTHTLKEISASFKAVMASDHVKDKLAAGAQWRELLANRNLKRTGQTSIENLRKYLDVYDMWQEKVKNRKPREPSGWDEILKHFEPGAKAKNAAECTESFEREHGKKPGFLDLEEMLEEEWRKQKNLKRKYQRYKDRAIKIIFNVGRGYFPGKY
jgi:hypothetical protein